MTRQKASLVTPKQPRGGNRTNMNHAPHGASSALVKKLQKVKLLLCDVDGVLTNGTVILGEGKEYKAFSIQDGLGLLLLQRHGIKVGLISNRPSAATEQRASELKLDFLYQQKGSKVLIAESILAKAGLGWEQICYVGDDIVDLGVLNKAGVSVAVANAIIEAKQIAHYTTNAEGGRGAVREVVRLILDAQGKWAPLVSEFSEE